MEPSIKVGATFGAGPSCFFIKPSVKIEHTLSHEVLGL
jgi:hypothetical protein